jgi:hypothetical protein
MWRGTSLRQVAPLAVAALALLGTASCATSSAGPEARTAAASRESAPRLRSVRCNYGLSTLPVSSPQGAGYYGARYAWAVSKTGTGDAGGAGQGTYWELAITDLRFDLVHDLSSPGGKQAYRAAISELRQMASLPDTDLTSQQNAEYNKDFVRLNHFFHSKGDV